MINEYIMLYMNGFTESDTDQGEKYLDGEIDIIFETETTEECSIVQRLMALRFACNAIHVIPICLRLP